jgi:hypothetical protein
MGTLLNRRRYMGGGSSLPYDAEVQYLVTIRDGSLTTTINNADIGYIKVVKQFASQPSGTCGDGGYVSSPRFYGCIGYAKSGLGMQWGTSGTDKKILDFDTNEHTFILDVINRQGTIDSTTVSLTISNVGNNFLINGYQTNRNIGTKYKSLEVYNMNMVKILDLIPIRKGQQGGWYDQVSGELMGVGSFTAGPDKT